MFKKVFSPIFFFVIGLINLIKWIKTIKGKDKFINYPMMGTPKSLYIRSAWQNPYGSVQNLLCGRTFIDLNKGFMIQKSMF